MKWEVFGGRARVMVGDWIKYVVGGDVVIREGGGECEMFGCLGVSEIMVGSGMYIKCQLITCVVSWFCMVVGRSKHGFVYIG